MKLPALTCIALIVAACGSSGNGSPSAPSQVSTGGPFAFTAALVDPSLVDFILPLGNLNPPGHTLPTDHIYFYVGFLRPGIRGVPVYAPGDGTVQDIIRGASPDVKLFVRVNATFMYYVDHVVLDPGITSGTRLTAGQRLGTSGTSGFGVDLGVMNFSRTLPFITPGRYPGDSLHADAPLRFYEEPLRSQLYALVRREGSDKDGKIDFDLAGRLQGNWFHESLSIAESAQASGWSRHLAFVFDNVQPTEPRIALGGMLGMTGAFGIDASEPAFSSVSPQSGIVGYRLRRGGNIGAPLDGSVAGTLVVEMLDATRIRVEAFPATTIPPVSFSSAARIYTR